jgi:hypothetical protein
MTISTSIRRCVTSARSSIFFSTIFTLAACASTPDSAAPTRVESSSAPLRAGGIKQDCQAWSMHRDGRYRYENNVWGSKKARGKFKQCLLTRERNGKTEVGWSWDWPGFDPSVFAYPEVVVGWKPWSGGATTDPHFPLRVSEVRTLTLDYEVESEMTGSYDLAPEIWLTDAGASTQPNPRSITTEVMFWMDHTDGARPAGKVVDEPTFSGVKYELWREDSIGVDANGKGWRLLSFKSPEKQLKGRIDIAALLHYLVERQLASTSDYVAGVEFGNEVMGGTGTTWIRQFDVKVEP